MVGGKIMKIVFNADDFGYSRATNFGIIDSFKYGVVRSTSLLVNTNAFDHAIELYKENVDAGLGVGIHLNLMTGKPLLSDVSSLVDANGNFYKIALFDTNKEYFVPDEIEREFEAQIGKALDAGVKLTHIDSHYGIHMQDPLFAVAVKLARKYDLPLRMLDNNKINPISFGVKVADKFSGGFFAQNATFDYLVNYIMNVNSEIVEILCRPAYVDFDLYNGTRYAVNRINEIDVLCNPNLKLFIEKNGFILCNFEQAFSL